MKTRKFYLTIIILFSLASNAQISKGNWMMGGMADFSHTKNSNNLDDYKATSFSITPNVGYFFIDKLAVGISGSLAHVFSKDNDHRKHFNYGIAPFVRYYFLEKEKPLNIFSEMSYGFYKVNNTDQKQQYFNVKAGAVYFLNSSVGLEVALNYRNLKYINSTYHESDSTTNSIFLGVGFQIHLEKE